MTLVQTEPKSIKIGGKITDMQGPCSTGFHVPTSTEFENGLQDIVDTLGFTSATQLRTYLHLPQVDIRNYDGTTRTGYNRYWLSNDNGNNYAMFFAWYISGANAGKMSTSDNNYKTAASPIRPFKNTPAIPDATWTKTYSGTGDAGVYYNSGLGLISLTGDGSTWVTIADKNLGATVVYNDGDTQSESNCGKLYQRGNNYGFAYTGTITTSSTRVDATGYGPGNYYSGSTYINYAGNWSSVQNDDLRGGVSRATKEVKKVYVGSTKVRPENKELCFTANTAGSTVKLNKVGSLVAATLETSTDGNTWTSYTFGTSITLSSIGDKVYFRTTSATTTYFSRSSSDYCYFSFTGSVNASGDVTSLINKNCTTTIDTSDSKYEYLFYKLFCTGLATSVLKTTPKLPLTVVTARCYGYMFQYQRGIKIPPELPATTLATYCYAFMFNDCQNLEALPKLKVKTLATYCYRSMFYGCTKIKLSTTQTGEYQTAYRIPTTGTGTTASNALSSTFSDTGGTFTGSPSINTTYYTSNTLV